jgi:hypothetical protein
MHLLKALRARIVKGKLSDVRAKDPEFEKAALFVEKLFGRSLRNNPKIISAVPLLPFVTYSGRYLNFPKKSIGRVNRLYKPILGHCPFDITSSLSHEIIHSEDFNCAEEKMNLFEKIKHRLNLRKRIVSEGRAVYAQHIFKEKIKRFETNFFFGLMGIATAITTSFIQIDPIAKMLLAGISALHIYAGCIYWPFHNSLVTLGKKLDDPIKAFKLTTEKPPGILGIIAPTRFYKKEIEEAKQAKG